VEALVPGPPVQNQQNPARGKLRLGSRDLLLRFLRLLPVFLAGYESDPFEQHRRADRAKIAARRITYNILRNVAIRSLHSCKFDQAASCRNFSRFSGAGRPSWLANVYVS